MKIAVLGSGSWGTALTQVLVDNQHEVLLYGIVDDEVNDINQNHRNHKFFPDVTLHPGVKASKDLQLVLQGAQIVLLAVPTQAIRSLCEQIKPLLSNRPIIVNVSKGFDPATNQTMSETIRSVIPDSLRQELVSLIGPSHAEEVVIRLYTAVSAVSQVEETAKIVQQAFANYYFRVYTLNDEIGAEFSVAAKNVIALASGIIYGLNFRDNTRAALITRGLSEIVRMGIQKGGKMTTFLGLTGIGDLVVTCSSFHSRNFQAGLAIGNANSAIEFLKTNTKTVEGIRTAKVLYEESVKIGLELPITTAVYQVIYEGKRPSDVVDELMNRELKAEHS